MVITHRLIPPRLRAQVAQLRAPPSARPLTDGLLGRLVLVPGRPKTLINSGTDNEAAPSLTTAPLCGRHPHHSGMRPVNSRAVL